MGAVVTREEGDSRTGVAGCAAQEQVFYRRGMSGARYQAALAYHLVRMQQAVGPVSVGNALHAGEVIG